MSMLKMKKENANNFCSISKDAPIQSLTKKIKHQMKSFNMHAK